MEKDDKQGWVRLLLGDTSVGDTSFIASFMRSVAVGRDGQTLDFFVYFFWRVRLFLPLCLCRPFCIFWEMSGFEPTELPYQAVPT